MHEHDPRWVMAHISFVERRFHLEHRLQWKPLTVTVIVHNIKKSEDVCHRRINFAVALESIRFYSRMGMANTLYLCSSNNWFGASPFDVSSWCRICFIIESQTCSCCGDCWCCGYACIRLAASNTYSSIIGRFCVMPCDWRGNAFMHAKVHGRHSVSALFDWVAVSIGIAGSSCEAKISDSEPKWESSLSSCCTVLWFEPK